MSTYFTTITVNKWIKVFRDFPETNGIVLNSLKFLSNEGSVIIYAFVIMEDHFHVVWKVKQSTIQNIVTRFKRYTGNEICRLLKVREENFLKETFNTNRQDRKFKFWKIKSKNILIQHPDILKQKIIYIHNNPTKGKYKIVELPSQYIFSSARSYHINKSLFQFLEIYV